MKKALLSAAITCLFAICAAATTHTVTVQNFSFAPATMSIPLGDTIKFSWVNGDHTTTSEGIPAAAAAWDNPMSSTSQTFIYVPTVAGTYNYKCTPHAPNMAGSFTVTAPAAISNVATIAFTAYPNPATSSLHIALPDATMTTIQLVSSNGSIVYKATIKQTADINTADLANGMYFLNVQQAAASTTRTITVAH